MSEPEADEQLETENNEDKKLGQIDLMFVFSAQNDCMNEKLIATEKRYKAKITELKHALGKKPMSVTRVMRQLISIRNTALLEMQSCLKFCYNTEIEVELQEQIEALQTKFTEKYIPTFMDESAKVSGAKVAKEVNAIFKENAPS